MKKTNLAWTLENFKFSLEIFNLAWRLQSRLKVSILTSRIPHQKMGVWWVARLKFSVSLENVIRFNLAWKIQSRQAILNFFKIWALWVARKLSKATARSKNESNCSSSGAWRGAPDGVATLEGRKGAFDALNKGSGALSGAPPLKSSMSNTVESRKIDSESPSESHPINAWSDLGITRFESHDSESPDSRFRIVDSVPLSCRLLLWKKVWMREKFANRGFKRQGGFQKGGFGGWSLDP